MNIVNFKNNIIILWYIDILTLHMAKILNNLSCQYSIHDFLKLFKHSIYCIILYVQSI